MMILLAFGLVVCGIAIGWYVREWVAHRIMWLLLKQQDQEEKEEKKKDQGKVMHITIKYHNGDIFVYEKSTNRFLVQGKTQEEVVDALVNRFENTRFVIVSEYDE